ncbi:MAG: (d)CMP kinase [Rhizobiales bacterium]|nr:(d)CMP kinase [Hyphomicrobiales bacterium]
MVIAIDGPAASGKGTLARLLAAHYGLHHLDTGALYRAVARDIIQAGGDLTDEATAVRAAHNLDASTLADPFLRTRGIGEAASIVAGRAGVRAALIEYQRAFARRPPGAVLDGRDIGTVVCPHADHKIFVVADVRVRAERRYRELRSQGFDVELGQVLEQISERDRRDRERVSAPLLMAEDAYLLDTSHLDIDAALRAAIDLIERGGQS